MRNKQASNKWRHFTNAVYIFERLWVVENHEETKRLNVSQQCFFEKMACCKWWMVNLSVVNTVGLYIGRLCDSTNGLVNYSYPAWSCTGGIEGRHFVDINPWHQKPHQSTKIRGCPFFYEMATALSKPVGWFRSESLNMKIPYGAIIP